MRAGRLDQVFDIEQPVKTRSASGGVTTTWTTFASGVWGGFQGLSGQERYSAEAFQSESLYLLEIRPLSGLTDQMRINMSGRYFDILAIDDLTARDRTVLRIKEGRSKGD